MFRDETNRIHTIGRRARKVKRTELMPKNIVQLYFENEKRVPFVVRRDRWPEVYGMVISTVRPRRGPNGWFGDVEGFPLPPLDGSEGDDYWGRTGEPSLVPNSGSYQWSIVNDIPPNGRSGWRTKPVKSVRRIPVHDCVRERLQEHVQTIEVIP
jgi:hypothetical protein